MQDGHRRRSSNSRSNVENSARIQSLSAYTYHYLRVFHSNTSNRHSGKTHANVGMSSVQI
jgi:hypothetical protein